MDLSIFICNIENPKIIGNHIIKKFLFFHQAFCQISFSDGGLEEGFQLLSAFTLLNSSHPIRALNILSKTNNFTCLSGCSD